MSYGEEQYGQHVLGLDVVYLSVGDVKSAAIRGITGNLQVTAHEWIVQPKVGMTFGDEQRGIDLLAGARYWHIGAHLDLDGTRPDLPDRSATRQWVDATGGFRGHWFPAPYVELIGA